MASDFISKLNRMLQDVELNKDLCAEFKRFSETGANKTVAGNFRRFNLSYVLFRLCEFEDSER